LTRTYVLDPAADADLRAVVRYTKQKWGVDQVLTYTAQLTQAMSELASGQGIYKELSDLHPCLRMTRCQHHYLFALVIQGKPAVILAILHERMDIMNRLKKRLN
jgi:plasmid stabilization system protein ParE